MTNRLSSVQILDMGQNRTYTCQFPTETFLETTISELQSKLVEVTGIGMFYQHLIFNRKLLEMEKNGREVTIGDYNIRDGSNITFVLRLLRGGSPGYLPQRIADVSSKDNFEDINLSREGAKWLSITRGINFQGNCRNRFCKAVNKLVMIRRGFYRSTRGMCMFNSEITKLKCPECKQTLDKDEIHGVGVYKARLQAKCKPRGKSEIVVDIEARDRFLCAECLHDRNRLDYEYIILIVKRIKGSLPLKSF
eukprot:TRINITY_DN5350_c0_g1_i1.p1 TRINITY_DN5350_c0_g1~~TRINITY_DN5350_c0_g1_i1.p1  ORF type:complete len:250 (-),score=47.37 TRINITY_DN5350_c0_g1_i1:257-1006(-)